MAKMKIQPEDRPKVKAECLRLLTTLRLDPARMQLISGFVDTYLRLNETEEATLEVELNRMGLSEEEQIMEIVTSWMEKGIERGLQQALERERTIALRQLNRKLGTISPDVEQSIHRLSLVEVELLLEMLLDFETEADLEEWLEQRRLRQEIETSILSQLNQRFGKVSLDVEKQIRSLPIARVEELAERMLDFEGEEAMLSWLNEAK